MRVARSWLLGELVLIGSTSEMFGLHRVVDRLTVPGPPMQLVNYVPACVNTFAMQFISFTALLKLKASWHKPRCSHHDYKVSDSHA